MVQAGTRVASTGAPADENATRLPSPTAMKSPWIRRTLIATAALLVLLVAVAALLLATFDANRYKSLAVDWMKSGHQRTLVIEGPIELSVFPRLAVKVSRLRLSERGRDDEFAAIDEASLALRLLPLLRKQLVIGRVSARGVRLAYLRDAQGRRNLDDLLALPGNGGGSNDATATGAPLQIDISEIRLDDLRLRLRDEMTPLAGEVALQSFSAGRLAHRVEAPVALRASLQLTQPQALKLTLDGRMKVQPDFEKNALAVTDMQLAVQGEAAGRAFALALSGALGWDGSALDAGPLQLKLDTARFGATTLTPSTLALQRARLDPARKELELKDLQLALAGRHQDQAFEFSLAWPQLAINGEQLQASALSGRVKLGGPSTLTGEFHSATPSGNFDALRLPGLAFRLGGSAGPRKVDAELKADLTLAPGRRALKVEHLEARATLASPGLQPLQLSLQGGADADAEAAQWQLAGALSGSRFNTQGRLAWAGAVPQLAAGARFDRLDLDPLLGPAAPATGTPAAAAAALPLDALKAVNGRFTFEAAALSLRQFTFTQTRLVATLDQGLLRLTQLAGRAWGGSFAGSGSADAKSQRLAFTFDAKDVDVQALLKDVADKDLLEGTGQVRAELQTQGAGMQALREHLAGTAALQMQNGAVKGFNLARALRQARAALSLRQDAMVQARATEKTDFSELRISARITDGVAHSDDLDLKSPFLRVGGSGRFDIGRGRIDYTARASVVASAAGQGSAELDALRGLTVPVLLSGPFDAITWKIQWSEVAVAALKGKLRDKLGEVLSGGRGAQPAGAASAPVKPKDTLKGVLKGLLK